jgi:hypothetical protein
LQELTNQLTTTHQYRNLFCWHASL